MASSSRSRYWRSWNIMRRLGGLWCACVALAFLGWAFVALIRPDAVPSKSVTLPAGSLVATWLAGAAVAFVISAWALRSRTYRPDLGDHNWFASPQRARIERRDNRNWWTGDPRGGTMQSRTSGR
jgi:hypothetical protein